MLSTSAKGAMKYHLKNKINRNNVINFKVLQVARDQFGAENVHTGYQLLLQFIYENRALPEFQRIIEKYEVLI